MKKILALAAVILSAGVSQAQAQHVDVNCAGFYEIDIQKWVMAIENMEF
jgi:hypothetical protein